MGRTACTEPQCLYKGAQTRTLNTHRWHTHAATYCVIIQTQRTQISGRNSNGTKHSGGPPEDGWEKKTETCRGFILTNTFLTFYWFWVLKWVCFNVWIVHELDCITSVATCTVRHWRWCTLPLLYLSDFITLSPPKFILIKFWKLCRT